ncbi:hypothetical protein YC2023_117115 [Brassica napus]
MVRELVTDRDRRDEEKPLNRDHNPDIIATVCVWLRRRRDLAGGNDEDEVITSSLGFLVNRFLSRELELTSSLLVPRLITVVIIFLLAPSHEEGRVTKKGKKGRDGKLRSSQSSSSEIESEFSHHDPAFARINNGSFGSCPSSVIAAQRDWQLRFLRQPDRFFFDETAS